MGPNVVNENKFFIDEFGINIHTRRNQGRSKKGDRVYRRLSGQRGPNITVCIAVSNHQGLVYYQVFAGGGFWKFCGYESLGDMNVSGICIYNNVRHHIRIIDSKTTEILTVYDYGQKCNLSWKQPIKRSFASQENDFISPTGEIINDRTLQQFRFDAINAIISSTAGDANRSCR